MMKIGFDPETADHSDPKAILGGLYSATFGGDYAVFRYVNVVDLDTADGDVVTPASTSGWDVTQDRSGGSAISNVHASGVAVGVITAGNYGFILVNGIHDAVLGDGSVAAGDFVVPDSAVDGGADTMADGEEEQVFGLALEADSGSPATFACEVRCL